MIDQVTSSDDRLEARKDCPQAAWMLLGSLNANRITPMHFEQTRDFVEVASTLPISRSYPILSWVIENTARRINNSPQVKTHLRNLFDATLFGAEISQRLATQSSRENNNIRPYKARRANQDILLFKAGEREVALKFLSNWFEDNVEEYLKICDPYFGVEDLEVIKLLQSVKPNCVVTILTSRQDPSRKPQTADDFRNQWKLMSDQNPVETEILLVGTDGHGVLPIHDRWWITKGKGLRLGISYNGLGQKKDAEISLLSPEQASALEEAEIDPFLHHVRKEHDGKRLLYDTFIL